MKRTIAAVLLIVMALSLIPAFADTETKTYMFMYGDREAKVDIPAFFTVITNTTGVLSPENRMIVGSDGKSSIIGFDYYKHSATEKPYTIDDYMSELESHPEMMYLGMFRNEVLGDLVLFYFCDDHAYGFSDFYSKICIVYKDGNDDYSNDTFKTLSAMIKSISYVDKSTATPKPTPTPAPTPSVSTGMKNALSSAKMYLNVMGFSREGLITQLKFSGFTDDEATYAVDNCGADWNEQAVVKAKQYLDIMPMSKSALITQLVFEGFTQEQAEYGASKAYN